MAVGLCVAALSRSAPYSDAVLVVAATLVVCKRNTAWVRYVAGSLFGKSGARDLPPAAPRAVTEQMNHIHTDHCGQGTVRTYIRFAAPRPALNAKSTIAMEDIEDLLARFGPVGLREVSLLIDSSRNSTDPYGRIYHTIFRKYHLVGHVNTVLALTFSFSGSNIAEPYQRTVTGAAQAHTARISNMLNALGYTTAPASSSHPDLNQHPYSWYAVDLATALPQISSVLSARRTARFHLRYTGTGWSGILCAGDEIVVDKIDADGLIPLRPAPAYAALRSSPVAAVASLRGYTVPVCGDGLVLGTDESGRPAVLNLAAATGYCLYIHASDLFFQQFVHRIAATLPHIVIITTHRADIWRETTLHGVRIEMPGAVCDDRKEDTILVYDGCDAADNTGNCIVITTQPNPHVSGVACLEQIDNELLCSVGPQHRKVRLSLDPSEQAYLPFYQRRIRAGTPA